jgi:hypothetical protein
MHMFCWSTNEVFPEPCGSVRSPLGLAIPWVSALSENVRACHGAMMSRIGSKFIRATALQRCLLEEALTLMVL